VELRLTQPQVELELRLSLATITNRENMTVDDGGGKGLHKTTCLC
jgi:hypothetical protein